MKKELPKDIVQELKGEAPSVVAMISSPGYKLWKLYSETMRDAWREAIIQATTHDEWLEAKARHDAVCLAIRLPEVLLDEIRALDSESTPTDAPKD